jgi:hypothetical protein
MLFITKTRKYEITKKNQSTLNFKQLCPRLFEVTQ